MSAKVNDGLNWEPKDGWLLKRPLPAGGWLLGQTDWLRYSLTLDKETGWGWNETYDKEYGGAALVAPLNILFWEKERCPVSF